MTRSGELSGIFSPEDGPLELVVRPPSGTRRALERISERRWKYSTLDAHELSDAASRHYSDMLRKQQRDNECIDEMFWEHLRENKDKLGTGQALAASLSAVAPSLELAAVPPAAAIVAQLHSSSGESSVRTQGLAREQRDQSVSRVPPVLTDDSPVINISSEGGLRTPAYLQGVTVVGKKGNFCLSIVQVRVMMDGGSAIILLGHRVVQEAQRRDSTTWEHIASPNRLRFAVSKE